MSRPLNDRLRGERPPYQQPSWLSEAIHATVHRTRGLAKVIAYGLGCKEPHITDLADATRRVPLKAYEIVELVRASGSFAILDALERQVGRVAYELPAVRPNPDTTPKVLIAAFGELLTADGGRRNDRVKAIDELLWRVCEYRAAIVEQPDRMTRDLAA